MTQLLHDQILATYDWTQTQLDNVLNAIPAEHYLHQPFPGANHALWTMGHLGAVDHFMLKTLAGRDPAAFESHRELFFAKSQPTADAGRYPPLEAVRDYFRTARAAFRAWMNGLDDAKLTAPLPSELQRFGPTLADLLTRLHWHQGMHYGQLTVLRKSLGLTPVRI